MYSVQKNTRNTELSIKRTTVFNCHKNKIRTSRKFKRTHDYENYLTNVRNIKHRVAITKLRLSNHMHTLAIETGR